MAARGTWPSRRKASASCPRRTLHLHFGDTPELLARLAEGRLDAVITSSKVAEGRFEAWDLHPEAYVLVGARRRLASHPFRGPKDAPGHVLLDLRPDLPLSRYLLDQAGGAALWPFGRVECLGTIAAVRLRVLQGAGLAVLPAYFVAADLAKGRLQRLLPKVRLAEDRFRLLWLRGHRRAPALAALGAELAQRPLA